MSLCPQCRHVRVVTTPKGSRFWLCQRSHLDARFSKYPAQPVVHCSGHEHHAQPELVPLVTPEQSPRR